jgi:hypothetical protein
LQRALPGYIDRGINCEIGDMNSLGAEIAAMLSARIRCAAFVGANPAKPARPRRAEVLPVTISEPCPASTIDGVVRRARCNSAMTLT